MTTLLRWQIELLLTLTRATEAARRALPDRARGGQGMAEYAIIASVLVTIVIVGLTVLANALSDYFASFGPWLSARRPT